MMQMRSIAMAHAAEQARKLKAERDSKPCGHFTSYTQCNDVWDHCIWKDFKCQPRGRRVDLNNEKKTQPVDLNYYPYIVPINPALLNQAPRQRGCDEEYTWLDCSKRVGCKWEDWKCQPSRRRVDLAQSQARVAG